MTDKNRERALSDVKLYLANDWNLKEETPEYFLLERQEQKMWVHVVLAMVFWWLLFIPNIIYWYVSKKTKKILK